MHVVLKDADNQVRPLVHLSYVRTCLPDRLVHTYNASVFAELREELLMTNLKLFIFPEQGLFGEKQSSFR